MTEPTIIFFGPDGGGERHNKVFIRTLLYSTSDKGQYIQNMFIRLSRGESVQSFNVWIYDDKSLVRGSGLFISKMGIACNHHFLLPNEQTDYPFLAGEYLLEIFIETFESKAHQIFEQSLKLTREQSEEMRLKEAGIYFDWAPNTQTYFSHVDVRSKDEKGMSDLMKVLAGDQK
ncbi:hypothetical protein SAMN05428949_0255 [Chitinophaga sp. YR627]|uniref:hypothetical protein n=1 Tax=Chitinophaga sp. YR627 TaxID=1881041 RepID=UPI0008F07307|nr:hypothetical protein [Chitinophaga sp. YR627]SFM63589.1 hypothetical protein SAMN05428949_0255 [Chitinophaga sp. YR627]